MSQQTDSQPQRSRPSNRLWIRDINESETIPDTNEISTRYGTLYRVHILGTIVEMDLMTKKEDEKNAFDTPESDENPESNPNIKLKIDDGTGQITVTLWNTAPDSVPHVKKGAYVHIIGPVRSYDDMKSKTAVKTILVEVIQAESNPNAEMYHNLKVIEKRVKIPKQQIKKMPKGKEIKDHPEDYNQVQNEDLSDLDDNETELETVNQLAKEEIVPFNKLKEKQLSEVDTSIINFIKKTDDGNGVAIKTISSAIGKSEKETLQILERLSQKNYVYSSNPGFWSVN